MKLQPEPLAGRTFHNLTVLEHAGRSRTGKNRWHCLCKCGGKSIVLSEHLKSGHTKSCGCSHSRPNVKTHGATRGGKSTSTHKSWESAKTRCFNPKRSEWKSYGGRGIGMCKRWAESFEAFLNDMGPRPPGTTLDRYPDQNGNYEPGNCRWATTAEQALNTRRNIIVTLLGKRQPVSIWADEIGISRYTIYNRLKNGWPEDLALSRTPKYWCSESVNPDSRPGRDNPRTSLSRPCRRPATMRLPSGWFCAFHGNQRKPKPIADKGII